MKLFTVAAGLVGWSVTVLAGQTTLVETGTATKAAEYVKLSVQVQSRCYKTAKEARSANDTVVNEVYAVMEKYITEKTEDMFEDPISTDGGGSDRQDEVYYERNANGGNEPKIACRKGWRTNKSVVFKLVDFEELGAVQEAVLDIVDKAPFDEKLGNPQTYASWGTPQPSLTDASWEELDRQVLKDAVRRAKKKLAVLVEEAGIEEPIKLVKAEPVASPYGGGNVYAASKMRAMSDGAESAGGGDEATYKFRSISAQGQYSLTFSYEGGELKISSSGVEVE